MNNADRLEQYRLANELRDLADLLKPGNTTYTSERLRQIADRLKAPVELLPQK